ncbi:YggS family pyridoxal phosphate-dependent enzyme [Crocinitomicaceae bacterium]|jgi:pyridoxal phosphate enzyme (YggS family)|nr:YggS family pyridoxal phosphate-dependent enzyme [Crocinitomicaceae bacterium]MDC1282706.1 YggS family pyridoxal phosphate-dependent enzyme [Crocinitomicaceae bacterium]MDC1384546.1 YggS family pyridoxal phosphate-dependent enzyme [Crocinitomicaceae bacterium]|tara:strand:+ start:54697 stop:55359 length:663 start_codon:yes stop_codon:yes gene_type:complete
MIKENLNEILADIPENVTLVAVSKTKPASEIEEAYAAGQRVFGENKVQEMVEKEAVLPRDIQWHLIGHVQTNKVKYIAPFVSVIHAVDSLKLLSEINKQAKKNNRTIQCMLQMHIADEESKFGMKFDELMEVLNSNELVEMQNVSIIGLMGMATFTDNEEQVREEFCNLEGDFNVIKSHFFKFNDNFKHLSMGMSGDYKLAIEEGSTMVRIGSSIFGGRN